MHAYRANNGQRGRVLYLFRSPSHVQIGRRALDPEVMEALEHTHPDLNFDWAALQRDPALRSNHQDEEPRPAPRRQNQPAQGQAAPAAPTVVIVEDHSLLGKTLGAEQARRLRAQFAELLQRIARRARTPDDRDRLSEQAGRLNPDGWADEATIQAAVVTVEADWQVISAQLPRRRRGRRGGRHATEARAKSGGIGPSEGAASLMSSSEGDEAPGIEGSGIIEESGDGDGAETDSVDREIGARDDRGDDDRLGTDAEAAATDPDAADTAGAAGDGVPGDSE